jgi:hypothetical protein
LFPATFRSPAIPRRAESDVARAPWACDPSELEITDSYEAEIIGEEPDRYLVAFADTDGGPVEASMKRQDFAGFPHDIREGTRFSIVVFRRNGTAGTTAAAWPVPKYWNRSLRVLPHGE